MTRALIVGFALVVAGVAVWQVRDLYDWGRGLNQVPNNSPGR